MVKDENSAWHAGVSDWFGRKGLNAYSIGIELDNNGSEPFDSRLLSNLIELTMYLQIKYNFKDRNVAGHSDVAPGRKIDPSHYFDWHYLAYNRIGYYPMSSGTD